MMKIEPVTLKGHLVRLEPLQMEHASELYEASRDPGLWTYKPVSQPRSLAEMEQLIACAGYLGHPFRKLAICTSLIFLC